MFTTRNTLRGCIFLALTTCAFGLTSLHSSAKAGGLVFIGGGLPVVTHPVVTHPVITHPIVTHPIVTHPIVTHPVITHPVVGRPVILPDYRIYPTRSIVIGSPFYRSRIDYLHSTRVDYLRAKKAAAVRAAHHRATLLKRLGR